MRNDVKYIEISNLDDFRKFLKSRRKLADIDKMYSFTNGLTSKKLNGASGFRFREFVEMTNSVGYRILLVKKDKQ